MIASVRILDLPLCSSSLLHPIPSLGTMPPEETRCRTYRYRLQPTFRQTQALLQQLNVQRELYNAAMEERINVWDRYRRSISYFEQCRSLKEFRDARPDVFTSGVRLCRGTLKRLDRAFVAFYRRDRQGEIPGYPRFKSAKRFNSLQWEDSRSWKVKCEMQRLFLPGIGDVKARYYRPLLGTPKAITVKREGKKWWVSVRCADVPAKPLEPNGREIGIDLGIINIVATSDGELIAAQRFGSKAQARLTKAEQARARSQPDSKRYDDRDQRVLQIHRKIANQRRNAAHQLSRRLVNEFEFIAVEDLEIARMVRRRKNESGRAINGGRRQRALNKAVYDVGWGTLLLLILYKAESAGRVVVAVDPRYTSQTCAECGHVAASNRVTQARFKCRSCEHESHADINAARNILRAGRAQQALSCADQ
jgi:putative transposase